MAYTSIVSVSFALGDAQLVCASGDGHGARHGGAVVATARTLFRVRFHGTCQWNMASCELNTASFVALRFEMSLWVTILRWSVTSPYGCKYHDISLTVFSCGGREAPSRAFRYRSLVIDDCLKQVRNPAQRAPASVMHLDVQSARARAYACRIQFYNGKTYQISQDINPLEMRRRHGP